MVKIDIKNARPVSDNCLEVKMTNYRTIPNTAIKTIQTLLRF